MTGKERVRKAIQFKEPDRVPCWFLTADSDMTTDVGRTASRTFNPLCEQELRTRVPGFDGELTHNEWGNIRGQLQTDLSTSETVRSAFQDWSEFDDWRLPDIDAGYRYEEAGRKLEGRGGKYGLAWFGSFYFGTLYNIKKMDELLLDLGLHQERLQEFCARLEPVFFRCLERWKEAGADGVLFGNDLGLQDRLFMNPDTWREIFLPFHRNFYRKAHELGLDVLMHSCGYIRDIIPDLIDAGLDVLQFDQIRIYDLDDLSRLCSGRICFFCPVDIQSVMPSGDKETIEREVATMIEKLGTTGGGFLGKDYPQWQAVGVKEEWAQWARDAFRRYGRYDSTR